MSATPRPEDNAEGNVVMEISDDHKAFVPPVCLPDVAAYESIIPSATGFSEVYFHEDSNGGSCCDPNSTIETFNNEVYDVKHEVNSCVEGDSNSSVEVFHCIFIEHDNAQNGTETESGDQVINPQLLPISATEEDDFAYSQQPIYDTISTSIEEVAPQSTYTSEPREDDVEHDQQLLCSMPSELDYCSRNTTDEDDFMQDSKPICKPIANPFIIVPQSICAPDQDNSVPDQGLVLEIKSETDHVIQNVISNTDCDVDDSVLRISSQVEISASAGSGSSIDSTVRKPVLRGKRTAAKLRHSRKSKPRQVKTIDNYADLISLQSGSGLNKSVNGKTSKKKPTSKINTNETCKQSKHLSKTSESKPKRKRKLSSTKTLVHNHKSANVQAKASGIKEPKKAPRRDDQVHLCGLCHKTFSTFSGLQQHESYHSNARPHVCEVCQRSFRFAHRLRDHMLIHTGEKPHKCTLCTQRFTHQNTFRRHMKRHAAPREEGKPFQCTLCCRGFTQNRNLKEHMNTHMGIKPYKCTMCPQSFIRKEYLTRHMLGHTGEAMFLCVLCKREYILESNLEKHMEQCHIMDV
jgi:hypothetical protein